MKEFVRPSPPRHSDLGPLFFEEHKFEIETIPTKVCETHASSRLYSPPNIIRQRIESYCSTASADSQLSSAEKTPSSWIKPSPTVNVHTTCGRHSDQLLFGGPSLKELARSIVKRK